MKQSPNTLTPCDTCMLSLLGALHDVHGASKTAIYSNTSSKRKLDILIEKGFVSVSPVPYSNKVYCSISDRGRSLFDALSLVASMWESEPDKEFGFRIVPEEGDEKAEDDAEAVAKTPTDAEMVQTTICEPEPSENAVSDEPSAEPQNEDENLGETRIRADSSESDGGDERWSRNTPEQEHSSMLGFPPTTRIRTLKPKSVR